MTIQKSIEIVDGKYLAAVTLDTTSPQSLTAEEKEALQMFGEPLVNFGGVISSTLTLPVRHIRIPTGFPVRQVFNTASDANAWLTEIINRITTVVTDLRAQRNSAAAFAKFEVVTI